MGIRMKDISFSYGEKTILHHINLSVSTGEHIGIVGGSGGGKSTLLKLLSGLYEVKEGILEVEGKTKPEEIRKQVAMVMQSAMLLPASIKENITCGHSMSKEQIFRAIETAKLTEWIATLPEGIDTFVGERGSKLSGGQAQRIAIARAIAKDAPVFLLDEATSALDMDTSKAMLLLLKNVWKEKTVIQVTHQLETLTDCHRIYRLEGGKLYDTYTT